MTAQEMFEELDLRKVESERYNSISYVIDDGFLCGESIVVFYKENKVVAFNERWFDFMSIKLHLAIHQQMIELEWIK